MAIDVPIDSIRAARAAGLRYVSDSRPGITRHRVRDRIVYRDPAGALIRDQNQLQRFRSLAIPPAWTQVWICPNPRGHLQATGRDARGRKQYRYHSEWRRVRDETKYGRMLAFGEALPRIRARVEADLSRPGLGRDKVLAVVVRLLDESLIRVGNLEYARANQSFGLTTLRDQHVDFRGGQLRFHFRGKSGKNHDVTVSDRRLARVVKACRDLPGQELFQYEEDGQRHTIDSSDVNEYLQDASGEAFTAKDFRTWGGTVRMAEQLRERPYPESERTAQAEVVAAIREVARHLGNTPSVCRKCYVHPAVITAFVSGALHETRPQHPVPEGLRQNEAVVLSVLTQLAASAA